VPAAPRVLVGALAVLGLAAVSCGADDDAPAAPSGAASAAAGAGAGSPVTGDITVFAAASLTDAFTEIGEVFEATHPGATARFSFAASSDLVVQIGEGAPADVFASADEANMATLTAAGGTAGEPRIFAINRLEIVTAPGNPERITGVADLADPDLIVVTCAAAVPCGRYSQELFANAGVTVTPRSYEENVKGVLNKVTLGEADAGIVYATDVLAAGDRADGRADPRRRQRGGAVPDRRPRGWRPAGGWRPRSSTSVLGPDSRRILARHGFTGP
jgi:molybdate transport system substrate-binding protein